jgi:hypothetical protein
MRCPPARRNVVSALALKKTFSMSGKSVRVVAENGLARMRSPLATIKNPSGSCTYGGQASATVKS